MKIADYIIVVDEIQPVFIRIYFHPVCPSLEAHVRVPSLTD